MFFKVPNKGQDRLWSTMLWVYLPTGREQFYRGFQLSLSAGNTSTSMYTYIYLVFRQRRKSSNNCKI